MGLTLWPQIFTFVSSSPDRRSFPVRHSVIKSSISGKGDVVNFQIFIGSAARNFILRPFQQNSEH